MKRLSVGYMALSLGICMGIVGCGGQQEAIESVPLPTPEHSVRAEQSVISDSKSSEETLMEVPDGNEAPGEGISRDQALNVAAENADVPMEDIYNVKIEQDREKEIPVFQVEFETQYGDYDFEIAVADGSIVGADYEVDEEWLDALGGSAVTPEAAKEIIAQKVPGASSEDVQLWQEDEDRRVRFEGELHHNGMKHEFELDAQTGIIFEWNVDFRG